MTTSPPQHSCPSRQVLARAQSWPHLPRGRVQMSLVQKAATKLCSAQLNCRAVPPTHPQWQRNTKCRPPTPCTQRDAKHAGKIQPRSGSHRKNATRRTQRTLPAARRSTTRYLKRTWRTCCDGRLTTPSNRLPAPLADDHGLSCCMAVPSLYHARINVPYSRRSTLNPPGCRIPTQHNSSPANQRHGGISNMGL